MIEIFKNFYKNLNTLKVYLILANILLVFFLILLNNLGVLPIKNLGNFIFFTFLLLLLALYRPGWSFLFFVGTIALENINVAPGEIGINVRLYQLFAALTITAVIIRLLVKRLNFELPKWKWIDAIPLVFAVAGFVSALFAINKSLAFKQSIIAASFVAIYFLVRIFVQNLDDLKKIIPFFLSSSIIVILYGIWQNWRFMRGLNSFETMPGRPNATFTEADWLGIYLVLLLAVIYSLVYFFQHCHSERSEAESKNLTNYFIRSLDLLRTRIETSKLGMTSLLIFLTLILVLLIITVSRSSWLGAGIVTVAFLLAVLKNFRLNQFSRILPFLAIAIFGSIGIVYIFGLTNFQLFNRIRSTGTGLQKITISCDPKLSFEEIRKLSFVDNIAELDKYSCRHINLEEIEAEKAKGKYVTEIYRTDPNVNIRQEIYQKSWEQVKKHPIFGIGWGNIGLILGKDERGTNLNSSNIFLETWLGSGIIGFLSFIILWVHIITKTIFHYIKNNKNPGELHKTWFLFIILGWIALTVTNLFNAGIFMGIVWCFIGISQIDYANRN